MEVRYLFDKKEEKKMKLFKKLAAAVLVAALALTMVGCGAGGTGSALDLKNEVLNAIEDSYNMNNKVATHTTAMDTAAAALIEKAATDETAKDENVTVKDLLKNNGTGNYIAIFMPYGQLRTEFMQYLYVDQMENTLNYAIRNIADVWYYNDSDTVVKIGNPEIGTNDPIEIGAATGKIKDKNYLVLLVQNAKA